MFSLTKRRKIAAWTLAGLLLLYTIAGFVAVPLTVHHILEKKVPAAIHRDVSVERVRFNPFTLTARLYGLSVSDRDTANAFVDVQDLTVNLQAVSLLKRAPVIKQLLVVQPRVHIQRATADRFNFSDLIPPPATQPSADPIRVVVSDILIANGRIVFQDKAATEPFKTTLSATTLKLTGLDTREQAQPAAFTFSTQTDTGAAVTVSGSFAPKPLEVRADLDLQNLPVNAYRAYYSHYLNHTVIKQGRLNLQAVLKWSDSAQGVEKGMLTVSDLAIQRSDAKMPMVSVGRFTVTGAGIDLPGRTIQLDRIETGSGRIHIIRDKQGDLNLLQAMAAGTDMQPQTAPSDNTGPQWRVTLSEMDVKAYTMQFEDLAPAQPATLLVEDIALTMKDLSTQPDHTARIEFKAAWGDKGKMGARGNLGIMPLKADLAVTAEKLDVRPLQPYIGEQIRLLVTSGFAGTNGTLTVTSSQQATAEVSYRGQASLTEFKSVDADTAGDFLTFNSLFINDLVLTTAPVAVTVNEVALTDFYNRLIIDKTGVSNIAAIMGKTPDKAKPETDAAPSDSGQADRQETSPPGPAKPAGQPAETKTAANDAPAPAAVNVKTVTLQGGNVDFTDLFIKPAVHLPMTRISGRVSGLDTIQANKADVFLKGMINDNVPMEITGQVNPLIAKPYVDLKLSVVGIDLSPFTPYSGKYLGHTLERGQLSMDLKYLLADNRLRGDNKIVLNQLTLGSPVASPSATKLPVKLAIALLKDRQGNIDIDLPVSGNIDDPEFSLGGIIGKMLVNLIVSIVTSPFKMLGALFGGGEELAYMDFDPGSAKITASNSGKLDTLAKILYERPNLKLEIQGRINPEGDTAGLRKLRFERQLKAAKLKNMVAAGHKAIPLDEVAIGAQERADLVARAYAAATFPKPRDTGGSLKELTAEEMENLLFTAIDITVDDLRLLAQERAAAAKDYLLNNGNAAPDRLFLIEPEIDKNKKQEDQKSRVQFNLT